MMVCSLLCSYHEVSDLVMSAVFRFELILLIWPWTTICTVLFNLFTSFQYLLVGSCYRSHVEVARKLSSSGSPQASSKSLPFAFNFPRSHAWACARPGRPDVRYRVICLQDRCFVSLLGVFFLPCTRVSCAFFLWHTWSIFKPVADMLWHAGAPPHFSLARPVRKPDWCQVLGSHRRWARHWPNRYLVRK